MEGTVKWFNRKKGYGFIAGVDGKEYFVHQSGLAQGRFLRDNDRVSFNPEEGERGPIAKNVVLVQKGSELEGSKVSSENETSEDSESESEDEEEPEEETAEEEFSEDEDVESEDSEDDSEEAEDEDFSEE